MRSYKYGLLRVLHKIYDTWDFFLVPISYKCFYLSKPTYEFRGWGKIVYFNFEFELFISNLRTNID